MTLADVTPIDVYLAEQANLTAVQRFAQLHDADVLPHDDRVYRDLVPLREPVPGEQFGFEVDLDACTGCKACVTACHSLNGLDDGESWRSVGLLHGSNGRPHRQTVTTACHHCLDPGCLNGCPANAYTKDAVTGIVKHLDDQCIGCGYCVFTCPYEVPQYNPRLGIVRKCDMCQDRLAAGEAPACVQGCPNGAIKITIVDTQELATAARTSVLVPDAPSSHITVPTTTYRSQNPRTDLIGADHFAVRPAHAHPPLALMLVLTQLSVGAFVVDLVLRSVLGSRTNVLGALRPSNAIVALVLGVLALGASVLHLGRPLYAFRAALGIRHSWLSREIVAFGAFAGLATAYAGALLTGFPSGGDRLLGPLVAATGLAAVWCSVMVYVATGRTWWRAGTVAPKFLGSTLVCGLATVLFTTIATSAVLGGSTAEAALAHIARPLSIALISVVTLKLVGEASVFLHLVDRGSNDLKRTSTLLSGDLRRWTWARFGAGIVGGLILPAAAFGATGTAAPSSVLCMLIAGAALLTVVAGELAERSLFFKALASPRMPGDLA
jgi:Fe-S-cluster-containing dehydrogenase component/DMSO reductase anchor subunit